MAAGDSSPDPGNIVGLIAASAARQPDASAILAPHQPPLSYFELSRALREGTEELRRFGIGRTDRVALVLPAGPAMAVASLTVCSAAICAPLNPDYRAAEFRFHLADLAVSALIVPEGVPTPARDVAAELGLLVIELSVPEAGPAGLFLLSGPSVGETSDHALEPQPDDIALILHTSGTTARPKMVPLSHRNFCATAENLRCALDLTSDDICLNLMPQFHIGGVADLLLPPLASGGSVVCMGNFSAPQLPPVLDQFRPTWTQVVPTMLDAILDTFSADPDRFNHSGSLKYIRVVAAALPVELARRFEATFGGLPVIEVYGMTETTTLIATNPLPPGRRKPGSVGMPAGPGVRVIHDDGRDCATGEQGEIVVRGDSVMPGYLHRGPERGSEFIDGWFRTGDVGRFDDDGYLHISGRIKEIINRSGEKISPAEIDTVLLAHPDIVDAAAFGLPHPVFGEDIAAAVVMREGAAADTEAIRKYLREHLAFFKTPGTLFTRRDIPRTQNGKIRRQALSDEYSASDPEKQAATAGTEQGRGSALANRLLDLWQEVLEVDRIGVEDDFFDLGGDSLKALTFISRLSEAGGETVFATAIYDAPNVAALEQFLVTAHPRLCERLLGSRPEKANADDDRLELPERIHAAFQAQTATWEGDRHRPDSLIVRLRPGTGTTPLIWCGGTIHGMRELAAALGGESDFYAMRAAHNILDASPENIARLADLYFEEITELFPEGPVMLGGFCQGGKINFFIARRLREQGRDVPMLFLHEKIMPEPYDGPVTLLLASESHDNPYNYFSTLDLSRLYTGDCSIQVFDGSHHGWFEAPAVSALAQGIRDRIPPPSPGAADRRDPSPLVSEPAVGVKAQRRLYFSPGQRLEVDLRVAVASPPPSIDTGAEPRFELGAFIYRTGDTVLGYQRLAVLDASELLDPLRHHRAVLETPRQPGRYRVEYRLLDLHQHALLPQESGVDAHYLYSRRRQYLGARVTDLARRFRVSGSAG